MKRVFSILMLMVATLVISGCSRGYADCETPDGSEACWNSTDESFRWEDGAVIEIGVDSDTMGAALVEKWDADFPALAGKLVFRNYGAANSESSGVEGVLNAQGEAPDVVLVIDNEVVGNEPTFLALHDYFTDLVKENSITDVTDIVNGKGTIYNTAFYDGMAFSWNETMFVELGLDTTDADGDNLPDAYDTWEEIFEMDISNLEYKGNKILEAFPISLDEVWSGYSSLTADGWQLFESGDLSDPGFDSDKFLKGLEFIKTFSEQGINVDETGSVKSAQAMGWRWDAFLNEEAYPFSLVGTWMDVAEAEETTNSDFRFAPMPTYDGENLSPLMKTKGFVVNGYTDSPSAASEVLRWLYTQETTTSMIANSSYLPAMQDDGDAYPTVSDVNKSEFGLAFVNNHMEPAGTLPNNSSQRAMNVYYSIAINDFYKAVWDGDMTPEEAQDAVVAAADAWVTENNA